ERRWGGGPRGPPSLARARAGGGPAGGTGLAPAGGRRLPPVNRSTRKRVVHDLHASADRGTAASGAAPQVASPDRHGDRRRCRRRRARLRRVRRVGIDARQGPSHGDGRAGRHEGRYERRLRNGSRRLRVDVGLDLTEEDVVLTLIESRPVFDGYDSGCVLGVIEDHFASLDEFTLAAETDSSEMTSAAYDVIRECSGRTGTASASEAAVRRAI